MSTPTQTPASISLKTLFRRRQPISSAGRWLKAGLGGLLAIALTKLLGDLSGYPLLMAPFGASCVLLFSVPESPLSQPVNVIGGHLVSTAVGLLFIQFFEPSWWSIGLAVGASITLMAALRVTHPPAGADPIVVFTLLPSLDFLLAPVGLGSVLLVIIALLFHRLPPHNNYPN